MKIIITVLLLIPSLLFDGELPCGNVREKRIVNGDKTTATALYKNLKNIESGAWKKDFWEETFTYIGEAHTKNNKIYKIGYLSTIWGQACRATNRLVIFNKDNVYLGQYGNINEPPKKITGALLYFSFDPQEGNTLDLEAGPPVKAWLDGENPEWIPVKKL